MIVRSDDDMLALCSLALIDSHKTIFFDITPFLFYVLTETDEEAGIERVVGYFSKV